MGTKRVLVAGIGNIFLGDDAFGCEVIRAWSPGALLEAVEVEDFGIRGYDLACALTQGYDAVVLVDALARGQAPGTVFLFEPDLGALAASEAAAVDPHSLDPVRVLQMASSLGALPGQLYLVGCEPAVLESEAGALGLSEPVRAAVPKALELLEALVKRLLRAESAGDSGGISPTPSGVTPR